MFTNIYAYLQYIDTAFNYYKVEFRSLVPIPRLINSSYKYFVNNIVKSYPEGMISFEVSVKHNTVKRTFDYNLIIPKHLLRSVGISTQCILIKLIGGYLNVDIGEVANKGLRTSDASINIKGTNFIIGNINEEEIESEIKNAVSEFSKENTIDNREKCFNPPMVKTEKFPAQEHVFKSLKAEELKYEAWQDFRKELEDMDKIVVYEKFKVKDIKFSGYHTIVFWEDGTKTIVSPQDSDKYNYDVEKAISMAFMKRALSFGSNYKARSLNSIIDKYKDKFELYKDENWNKIKEELSKKFKGKDRK